MTRTLWQYWEGECPKYIQLCLKTVQRVCQENNIDYNLVVPCTVKEYLPELQEVLVDLPQAGIRADVIRSGLLARYGGWWFDADTIGVNDPFSVGVQDTQLVYMTWSKPPRRVLNGYIYAPESSTIASQWYQRVLEKIQRREQLDFWTGLGEGILTPLVKENPDPCKEVPRHRFLPIDIDLEVERFFKPEKPIHLDHTICWGLNHSWFMYHREKDMLLPEEKWTQSPLLIHQLLVQARSQWC